MTYSNEEIFASVDKGAKRQADDERFYIRYQAEAMPRGESIQAFCDKNKVPFNLFNNCKAIGEFL